MVQLIGSPTRVEGSDIEHKTVDEYFGLTNTGDTKLSVNYTRSPEGWQNPIESTEFHEYFLVLKGMLQVEHEGGTLEVNAGQAFHVRPFEDIRLSSPREGGAEYVQVCMPAYSPADVKRL